MNARWVLVCAYRVNTGLDADVFGPFETEADAERARNAWHTWAWAHPHLPHDLDVQRIMQPGYIPEHCSDCVGLGYRACPCRCHN